MPKNSNWIPRSDAAALLGVTAQTISNYAAKGLIQVRGSARYPLYYRPEVEALAADTTYQQANVIAHRAQTLLEQAQAFEQEATREYARRKHAFEQNFQRLLPPGAQPYNNLMRYQKLLRKIVGGASISEKDKLILLGVLDGKTPGQIMADLPYHSHNSFVALFDNALKHLVKWYGHDNEITRQENSRLRELLAEKETKLQTLGRMLKEQEHGEALAADTSPEDKTAFILKTVRPYNIHVSNIGLSVRAFNCLRAAGIETLGQLCIRTRQDMIKMRNLGKKSFTELERLLAGYGLDFGHNPLTQGADAPLQESPAADTYDHEPWTFKINTTGAPLRLVNLLAAHGITTVGELARLDANALRSIKGMGDKSFKDARRLLRRYGVNL